MENIKIKTIQENEHRVILSDLQFIQLSEMIQGISSLGGMRLEAYQLTANDLIKEGVKEPIIDLVKFINSTILFFAQNQSNAMLFYQEFLKTERENKM